MIHSEMLLEVAEDVMVGHVLCHGEDGKLHSWRGAQDRRAVCGVALKPFKRGDMIDMNAAGHPMTYEEVEAP